MPQLIVRYDADEKSGLVEVLRDMGWKVRQIVAEAASTDSVKFTEHDIDWVLQPYAVGSQCPRLMIELRTIGFPERKKKLNLEAVRALKEKIIDLGLDGFINRTDPLIWVQFIDSDGVHV